MAERRRAKRVPLSTAFSETDPRTTTPVSNLSELGVFVHTDRMLPVGSRIELRFTVFPDNPVLFQGTGRVVRHQSNPLGMGVEFDALHDEARTIIGEILSRETRSRTTRRRSQKMVFLKAHELSTKLVDDPE